MKTPSRTFLNQNADAKTLMTMAVGAPGNQRRQAHAARSNNRFLDERIADMETRLLDHERRLP